MDNKLSFDDIEKKFVELAKQKIETLNMNKTKKKFYMGNLNRMVHTIRYNIFKQPNKKIGDEMTINDYLIKLYTMTSIDEYLILFDEESIITIINDKTCSWNKYANKIYNIIIVLAYNIIDISKYIEQYNILNNDNHFDENSLKIYYNTQIHKVVKIDADDFINKYNLDKNSTFTSVQIKCIENISKYLNNKEPNLLFLHKIKEINEYLYNYKKYTKATLRMHYNIIKLFINDDHIRNKYNNIVKFIKNNTNHTLDDINNILLSNDDYDYAYDEKMRLYLLDILKDKKMTESVTLCYMRYLKNFAMYVNNKNIDLSFLNEVEKCKEHLADKTPSNIIRIICAYIKVLDTESELYSIYKKILDKYGKLNLEKRGNNIRTDDEKNNWIDYNNIDSYHQKIIKYFDEEYGSLFLKIYDEDITSDRSNKEFIVNYLNELNDYIVFSLYTLRAPLRYDYNDAMIITDSSIADSIYSDTHNDYTQNYIYINDTNVVLYLNSYKTYKSFGKQKIVINQKLSNIIINWVNILKSLNETKYLFHTFSLTNDKIIAHNNTNSTSINNSLRNIIHKFLNINTDINTSFMRKCYTTYLINSSEYKSMTYNCKCESHLELLHSFDTAHRDYYYM